MCSGVFTHVNGASAVTRQPESEQETRQAHQALLACPTYSIHTQSAQPGELRAARDSFPLPIGAACPSVYHLGFHDEKSFGAAPYLLRRESGGNVMVDCPRYTPMLAEKLKALGGVAYIFLTHEDDVGDHARWAAALGAKRIIHRRAVRARQGTDNAECILDGQGPWQLPDGGDDVQVLYTPGHTAGCISLYYLPERVLFPGDHLAWSPRLGRLTIFRAYNWHSVPLQLDSVRALLHLDFMHLLPGHGRRFHFGSQQQRVGMMQQLLEAEAQAPVPGR